MNRDPIPTARILPVAVPLLLLLALVGPTPVEAAPPGAHAPAAGPTYDSPETRERVEAMLAAHGYDRWREVRSIRLNVAMYLPEISRMLPGRPEARAWRHYHVTLDPRTSLGYVEMPFAEGAVGAVFDGRTLRGTGYTPDPRIADPPAQLLYMHSSIVRMPFLTQLDGASLADDGQDRLPGRDRDLPVVRMDFQTDGGPVSFRLFIDPETNLLVGFEHTAFFPPLPGGIPALAFPPMPPGTTIARIVEERFSVDGVLLPRHYVSVAEDPDGSVRLTGTHAVLEVEFDVDIDEDKLRRGG